MRSGSADDRALFYEALHDPDRQAVLTTETDTGSGGYTHRFYRASKSAEDLVAARDAIAATAQVSSGWIGRSPDYKAAFLVSEAMGATAKMKGFAEHCKAEYDLDGWRVPDLVDASDVSIIRKGLR